MIDLAAQSSATPADAMPSLLRWGRPPAADAVVTITIPTYNRSHLLPATLESALAQRFDRPFWIIVTDNVSDDVHQQAMLSWLEERAPANVSYYVNAGNIGMFPNWNRGPALATSRWITILNDDDLLAPSFLTDAVTAAERHQVPALGLRVRSFDSRKDRGERQAAITIDQGSGNPFRDLMKFRGRSIYRASIGDLFWGNELGNSLGFLVERDLFRRLGGFVVEDMPTADYTFYARLVLHARAIQLDKVGAFLRIEENLTMRPETLDNVVRQDHLLREAMVRDGVVPSRWRRYLPLLIAEQVALVGSVWGVALDHRRIAASLDLECVRYNAIRLKLLRLRYRGF